MNLEFCRWLANRNDEIDLMVHEPGLGLWEGGLRHNAAAAVHRAMLILLLTPRQPAFGCLLPPGEPRLRPYAFGRKDSFRMGAGPE